MKNKFLFSVAVMLIAAVTCFAQRPESMYARLAAQGIAPAAPVKTSSATAKAISAKKAIMVSPATITSCPSCDTLHFQSFTPDPNFISIYDTAYVWEHTYEYNEILYISTYCGYYKFKEGCVNFYHYADTTWAPMIYWDGFTVSKTTSFPTPLPASDSYSSMYDQFSAMPQQGVLGATDPYTVAYYGYNADFFAYNHCGLTLDAANTLCGMYVTNNAYVYNSIKYGDSFARAFTTGDYFKLTIKGYRNGTLTDTVQYYLADYRSGITPYVITTWKWVNLSKLGTVDSVAFDLYTTDEGQYGPNTPMYFCMDEFRVGTSGCGTCPATQRGSAASSSSSRSLLKSANEAETTTATVEVQSLQLSVAPNPASTEIRVAAASGCVLQVFDAQATLKYSVKMQADTEVISLAGFKTGTYSVVVNNGSDVKSVKFTKQ